MTATGLARALSKMGYCSRSQAAELIRQGKVTINDRVCRDPERRVVLQKDRLAVAGATLVGATRIYLMLNKPRGLVTSAQDEKGRPTVFDCLKGATTTHLSPVGRLDKASEGLLLFTNDNAWANRITVPETHLDKRYHVQISGLVDDPLLQKLHEGIVSNGETLRLKKASVLRSGEKNCWLDITLDEGRNRHIRRVLQAFDIEVLRLVRVAIGSLTLGELAKGQWRHLTPEEVHSLGI